VKDNSNSKNGLTYRDAGVDIDAGNALVERIKPAVRSTSRAGVLSGLGGFGGMFELDTERYEQPVLVSGTDGVGTKLLLARQLGDHSSIGIDLVAMCVNDILTSGAEPLFFLDYYATGKLELGTAQTVIEGIAEGCRQAGCALIGGETAEMPGMYSGDEYDLAGFCVGVVERSNVIDGRRIEAGHVALGLPSSGPHSNGYSLIRKILESAPGGPGQALADTTIGAALLAPTRIYVRTLQPLLAASQIDGLAHVTGGGLTENVVRVIPEHLGLQIDLSAWTMPPVFEWLQTQGNIEEAEMLRTFNCGIGMVLLVSAAQADAVRGTLAGAGETVHVIGQVTPCPKGQPRATYIRS